MRTCGNPAVIVRFKMELINAILLALLVIVLARFAVINAVALRRDMNKRFDDLRVRLESEALSTVDLLLRNAGNNSNESPP
jgi:hypothetical protein